MLPDEETTGVALEDTVVEEVAVEELVGGIEEVEPQLKQLRSNPR